MCCSLDFRDVQVAVSRKAIARRIQTDSTEYLDFSGKEECRVIGLLRKTCSRFVYCVRGEVMRLYFGRGGRGRLGGGPGQGGSCEGRWAGILNMCFETKFKSLSCWFAVLVLTAKGCQGGWIYI